MSGHYWYVVGFLLTSEVAYRGGYLHDGDDGLSELNVCAHQTLEVIFRSVQVWGVWFGRCGGRSCSKVRIAERALVVRYPNRGSVIICIFIHRARRERKKI